MKLKVYNSENSKKTRSGKPSISFGHKGVICINKLAVDAIKLKPGDCISIAQDEEKVKEWYLFKDANGIKLRENTSGGLVSNASLICEDIRACLKDVDEAKSSSMIMITEPTVIEKVKYYPILTASAK